jgi:tetratricopeptide (TPR) repeat protein
VNRRERRAAAKGSQSASGGASGVVALYEAGVRHIEAGRFLDAQVCCRQALELDAHHADTLHLMGLLSFGQGQYDHAVEWIANAVRQSPKAEYLSNLGAALQRQGRRDDALKAFDKAVQLKPDDAGLWTNLGLALEDLKRPSDALLCFQRALELDPRHLEAAFRCAQLLHQLGKLEEALALFDVCDELRPLHVTTLWSRSLVLRA